MSSLFEPSEKGQDTGSKGQDTCSTSQDAISTGTGSASSTWRQCKWCLRTNESVEWTRGGKGPECKTDAAWLKLHFATSPERATYLDSLNMSAERRAAHTAKIIEYEMQIKERRRKHVEVEEAQVLEGATFLGNFWPKQLYESHFDKKIAKKDLFKWDGKAGIMLQRGTEVIPGVTEVTSRKQRKVAVKETLPQENGEADVAFGIMRAKLDVKVKQKDSDTHGAHFELTMPRAKQGAHRPRMGRIASGCFTCAGCVSTTRAAL